MWLFVRFSVQYPNFENLLSFIKKRWWHFTFAWMENWDLLPNLFWTYNIYIYIYMAYWFTLADIFSIARSAKHSYCPRCETGPLFSIMTVAMAAVIIENNGPASCMITVCHALRAIGNVWHERVLLKIMTSDKQ